MEWSYKGKDFTTTPEDNYGFIYCITYTNGKKYVGCKQFYSKVTLPAKKSGEQRPNSKRVGKNKNGKRVYFDVMYKQSNWLTYEGSTEHSEGLDIAFKEIIKLVELKRSLLYQETKAILCMGCLETDDYLNVQVIRKFHKGSI